MIHIYTKELLEILRDRRALVVVVLLPFLVFPLIFGAFSGYLLYAKTKESSRQYHFAITEDFNPQLVEDIQKMGGYKLFGKINRDSALKAIRDKEVDFVINQLAIENHQLVIEVWINNADRNSMVKKRLESDFLPKIEEGRALLAKQYNIEKGVLNSLIKPVKITFSDISDKKLKIGSIVGGVIPYILLLVAFTGASYPAIDIGVGEKERGTLETLLTCPTERGLIALAKILVLTTTSLIGVLLTLGSLGGWLILSTYIGVLSEISVLFEMYSLGDIVSFFVLLLPCCLFFGSVLFCLSIYSRSVKEANLLINPFMMIIVVAVMVAMMPETQLSLNNAVIPITNTALAMKSIISGTFSTKFLLIISLFNCFLSFGFLLIARIVFSNERVLLRK